MSQELFLALSNAKELCVRNLWSLVNQDSHDEGERVNSTAHSQTKPTIHRQPQGVCDYHEVAELCHFQHSDQGCLPKSNVSPHRGNKDLRLEHARWCAGSRARRSCSWSTVSHRRWLLSELDSSGLLCPVQSWEAAVVMQPQHISKWGRNGECHTDIFQSLCSLSYKSRPISSTDVCLRK